MHSHGAGPKAHLVLASSERFFGMAPVGGIGSARRRKDLPFLRSSAASARLNPRIVMKVLADTLVPSYPPFLRVLQCLVPGLQPLMKELRLLGRR